MTVQGIATSDFSTLNDLKVQAKNDAQKALPEVAKQFEAIFLQSMLKSMRMGQHFLSEDSPFRGKNQDTFEEMLDGQYVSSISGSKGIGLATMLAQQLQSTVAPEINKPKDLLSVSPINPVNLPKSSELNAEPSSHVGVIDDFVKSIWPLAKEAAAAIGLDPKILMAQAALETGWGKFIAKDEAGNSSNNLFNIKAGVKEENNAVQVKTTEYIADTPIKMNASFRKYSSVEHSFNDYISLVKGSERYQNAVASASNPERYVQELHKAGYATDPKYGSKILSIYHGEELNQALQRCGIAEGI